MCFTVETSAIDLKLQHADKNMNASRSQEFLRRWTVSLELSACHITTRDKDISLVQFKRLLKTLRLCRAAAHSDCCFFCAVYKNLLTY